MNLKLYFWQNIISPHQFPYIDKLTLDERIKEVYLIVPAANSGYREKMGIDSSQYLNGRVSKVNIVIAPTDCLIQKIYELSDENTYHFYSGIRGFKEIFYYFKLSLSYQLNRGLIVEPPYVYKYPLFLHYIRFYLQDFQYVNKIKYVYGMGERACKYYKSISKKWRVFPFQYCTDLEIELPCISSKDANQGFSMVFVGAFSRRKNVYSLLKAFRKCNIGELSLDLIGDGEYKTLIENYIRKYHLEKKVRLLGFMSNKEVKQVISQYDLLVLPSLYDGWGAVVNEALLQGLYVICSNKCGARQLIVQPWIGMISGTSVKKLYNSMVTCWNNRFIIKGGRYQRRKWAVNIQSDTSAKYFADCLLGIISKKPWENE